MHLPWSRGYTDDDKILRNTDHFTGQEVVITEKMDGENTTMYPGFIHARSLDSKDHPSRHYVKTLHGGIKYLIPEGYRLCGENVYAKHSLLYSALPSYFMLFSVWNELNVCLSWDGRRNGRNVWGWLLFLSCTGASGTRMLPRLVIRSSQTAAGSRKVMWFGWLPHLHMTTLKAALPSSFARITYKPMSIG